jgi:hypothetical protein
MEGMVHQILEILQGGNRHLDPYERRPPHDNHGQQPRDDDSDDDDSHHPPGARIRRPVAPNAGPIPLPGQLDIARPGRDNRPVIDAGPEDAAPAADPAPEHIFAVDQIGAVVRELQARLRGEDQPIPDVPIADQPIPSPPTPATSFTNPDPKYVHTFDELKLTMESLKKQYHDYTTSESFFSINIKTDLETDDQTRLLMLSRKSPKLEVVQLGQL